MAYEFRKTYNLAEVAGVSNITGTTLEDGLTRANAVKAWLDENYGDIFETEVYTFTDGNGSFVRTHFYYKGTTIGFWIQQHERHNSAGICYNNNNGNNNDDTLLTNTELWLAKAEINLLIIKSKYGVIAGIYKDMIGTNIKSMAINHNNHLHPILLGINNTNSIINGAQMISFTTTMRNQSSNIILTRFAPPYLDFIPEGIYWSQGAVIEGCPIYNICGIEDQFAELPSINGCESIAMKLVEPTLEDYANIQSIRDTAEPAAEINN